MPLPSLANFTCTALTIEQKHLSRDVSRKRFSKNMQHIYRRTPMPKSDFNKVTNQLFFLFGFSFTNIHNSQDRRGRGVYLYNSSLPLPPLQRHLDISRAITAESSALRIAGSRTRTGNRWFLSANR